MQNGYRVYAACGADGDTQGAGVSFPDTEGYRITAQSKRELVQGLMMAVEQRRVTWPAAWEVLTAEMRRYEYAAGPSGQVTYSAPSGYHDD